MVTQESGFKVEIEAESNGTVAVNTRVKEVERLEELVEELVEEFVEEFVEELEEEERSLEEV